MNEDESTYEVPDYILSRLQPTLTARLPRAGRRDGDPRVPPAVRRTELLDLTVEFLQEAHELKLDFSPRDGINLLRFAIKRMAQDPDAPARPGRRLARSAAAAASARRRST